MPMYEYHCEDCGQECEEIVSFADANQAQPCPTCAGRRTIKKISIAAVIGSALSSVPSASSAASSCGSGGRFT